MSSRKPLFVPPPWLSWQYLMTFSFGIGSISLFLGATFSFFPWFTNLFPSITTWVPGKEPMSSPREYAQVLKSPRTGTLRSPRTGAHVGFKDQFPQRHGSTPHHHEYNGKLSPLGSKGKPSVPQVGGLAGSRKKLISTLRLGLLLVPLAYLFAFRVVFNKSMSLSHWGQHSGQSLEFSSWELRQRAKSGLQNAVVDEGLLLNGTKLRPQPQIKAAEEAGGTVFLRERPATAMPPRKPKWRIVNWKRKPRVAICLVGGAREFQLTGPSIVKHLLGAYEHTDIFLHSPLDENSHKLSLLAAAATNVVDVRIAPDVPINETQITDRLLAVIRCQTCPDPQTRQGLMQQFKGVETCVSMITAFEQRHKFHYHWVLRTRVDGYWTGPPPALGSLDRSGYTIPAGSDWGGLNDRLGMGSRAISWLGLRRLSVLRELADDGGYSALNAEKTYLAQMEFLNIKVTRASFPFCILSHKKASRGFPVSAALSSTAALNGAKCRPCTPSVVGKEAAEYISQLPERVFGPEVDGVDLCEAEGDWTSDWKDIFDRDAGADAAQIRTYMEGRTLDECVRDWNDFQPWVRTWDAPPARVVCMRAGLGELHKGLGFPRGEWAAYLEYLDANSTVYSMGVGEDYTFDAQVTRATKGRIHAFDSTPMALKWIGLKTDELPSSWIHHPWMLSTLDGELTMYSLDVHQRPFQYGVTVPENVTLKQKATPMGVEAKTLATTMRELGHARIDLLRVGGHISLHESLFEEWIAAREMPPICQVSVSFFRADKHYGSAQGRQQLLRLREIGLELAVCIQKDRDEESCLFFSLDHCKFRPL
eukprot:jgi/Mesen1/6130/ME000313S05252